MTRPSPLNVMARDADSVLTGLLDRCAEIERVDSIEDVPALLAHRPPAGPVTLDLLGHSTTAARLLRLGRSIIDMCDPRIARFFQELADGRVLDRAGVVALRLLGCETATMPGGQYTMRRLSATLRMPVFGSRKPLGRCHHDARGFDPAFEDLLVEAGSLPRRVRLLRESS